MLKEAFPAHLRSVVLYNTPFNGCECCKIFNIIDCAQGIHPSTSINIYTVHYIYKKLFISDNYNVITVLTINFYYIEHI